MQNVLCGEIESNIENLVEVFKKYVGGDSDTITITVDNELGIIKAELKNHEEYSKTDVTANRVEVSLDKSNFIMTVKTINILGDIIDTQSIDFPIESAVVNGRYENGKIILVLQNEQELSIPITDLTSNLVTNDGLNTALLNYVTKESFDALQSSIPTKLSQFENDSNFVSQEYVNDAIENAIGQIETLLSEV